MNTSKTATIYFTATQKQGKNIGYFASSVVKNKGKKAKLQSGIFLSANRNESQLKALIHTINLIGAMDEMNVYSDSNIVEQFLSGTVAGWNLDDWCKDNGKPIDNMELWKELDRLVDLYEITFHRANKSELSEVTKLLNNEKKKPERCMTLNLGGLVLPTSTLEAKQKFKEVVTETPPTSSTKTSKKTKKVEPVTKKSAKKDTVAPKESTKVVASEKTSKKTPTTDKVAKKVIPVIEPIDLKKNKEIKPTKKSTVAPEIAEIPTITSRSVIPEKVTEQLTKKSNTSASKDVVSNSSGKEKNTSSLSLAIGQDPEVVANNNVLTITLDPQTRKECDAIFDELGLDTATAVKIFLKKAVRTKQIPFDLTLN